MKFDSIRTRLSVIAVIFIMGTSITMGCVGIWLTHKYVKQRFHENYVVLSQYLARNAELGVLLKSPDMLRNLTATMMQQEGILKVQILDDDGNVITESRQGPQTDEKIYDSAVSIRTPVIQIQPDSVDMAIYGLDLNSGVIGHVELFYTATGLVALTRQLSVYFMVLSIFLSLVSIIWYWYIARSITAPLISLVAISRQVSRGDLDVRASGGDFLETRVLARGFNEMLDAVKDHRIKREKMHIEMAKQKSLAEIGKFSMMVAHELKNPISIIKGSMDIFKKKGLDQTTKQSMILFIEEEIVRLNRLVDDFLLFSKPKKPLFSNVSMAYFLGDVVERFRFTVPEKEIKLCLHDNGDTCMEIDRMLMERALLNILSNAVDHCNGDAPIEVHGRKTSGGYEIAVKDRGPGVAQDLMEEIFNPFYTTRAKGTGLGLAIVRDIVTVHNATVLVENRPEGGASFEINLVTQSMPSFLR
ncbi:MAG: HAMP domain-containing protein [Desulfamplus sp.]|nr:HAMP domain-containing protein [Desulfamplus sp.]